MNTQPMKIAFSFPNGPEWSELNTALESLGIEPIYCSDHGTLKEFLRLNQGSVDLMVVDSSSVHHDSELRLITELKHKWPGLPVTFSARTMSRGLAIAGSKAGADECVLSSNLIMHIKEIR